jgi:hypothetical protein
LIDELAHGTLAGGQFVLAVGRLHHVERLVQLADRPVVDYRRTWLDTDGIVNLRTAPGQSGSVRLRIVGKGNHERAAGITVDPPARIRVAVFIDVGDDDAVEDRIDALTADVVADYVTGEYRYAVARLEHCDWGSPDMVAVAGGAGELTGSVGVCAAVRVLTAC